MADLETKVDNLDTRVTSLEQQVSNVTTKLDMFIADSRDARKKFEDDMRELRQRQEAAQARHDADMKEMRQDMKDMQQNIYAKMDHMDSRIEGIGEYVRNMSIAVIIGIAAMVVTVFLK